MIFSFLKKDIQAEKAADLYGDVVEQARSVPFYETLQVPDTVSGRFDMITLHMFLVLRRLKQGGQTEEDFAQKLFNVMFQNMDDSLRELGVGDLSVGKKVRHLAEAFYGRVGVYEKALDETDKDALAVALRRNVFGDDEGVDDAKAHAASGLAAYVIAAEQDLQTQSLERLSAGIARFPSSKEALL